MPQDPKTFYQSELLLHQSELKAVKTKLRWLSLWRLLSFLIAGAGVYFTIALPVWPVIVGIAGVVLFLILVSRYTDLKQERDFQICLIKINQDELDELSGKRVERTAGEEFADANHAFSSDIDLFGEGSFFQLINRSSLKEGTALLASVLKSNHIDNVDAKQAAVKELAEQPVWRHNYSATAAFVKTKISRAVIVNWLKTYSGFVPSYFRYAGLVFPVISFLVLGAYIFGLWPLKVLGIVFGIGLGITGLYVKKINKLSIHVSELKQGFSSYAKLIAQIENMTFTSEICRTNQLAVKSSTEAASEILKTFSKHLSALDQRNNILFALIGNGFLLWDTFQAWKIEQWIKTYNNSVESWFQSIEFFDAYNSLGAYAFNRPEYTYPNIQTEAPQIIKVESLGHVLIDPAKRIDNNFSIDSGAFHIITGANMAGKSTFLRTVALTIVSANIGLPVCGKNMLYRPTKLITSMRNTDSLQDDSSYFFSELVRLKLIVETIQDSPHFIILDEILKGTNSKDKEEGSKKLMRKLSLTGSSGIIATHDLGLCEIAQDIPSILNYYFDAEIEHDELFFDYQLKPGICQNMNASFLLHKMQIV